MAPRHVCARRAAHGPWLPHLLWLLRRRRRLSHAQRGYLPRSLRRQRRSRTAPHSTPATGREGRYSTLLYAERAAKLIEDFGCRLLAAQATVGEEASATIAPASLFIYLAWQAIHSPDEAPAEFIARFADSIPDTPDGVGQHRRIVAGMVACLDEGMANVTGALRRAQLFDTTLIVFSTDNGGPAQGFNSNMASNWPLRGMKRTLREGGLHGVSFVSGAGLLHVGYVSPLLHVTDWHASLLSLAANGLERKPDSARWVPWTQRAAIRRWLAARAELSPYELGDGVD